MLRLTAPEDHLPGTLSQSRQPKQAFYLQGLIKLIELACCGFWTQIRLARYYCVIRVPCYSNSRLLLAASLALFPLSRSLRLHNTGWSFSHIHISAPYLLDTRRVTVSWKSKTEAHLTPANATPAFMLEWSVSEIRLAAEQKDVSFRRPKVETKTELKIHQRHGFKWMPMPCCVYSLFGCHQVEKNNHLIQVSMKSELIM